MIVLYPATVIFTILTVLAMVNFVDEYEYSTFGLWSFTTLPPTRHLAPHRHLKMMASRLSRMCLEVDDIQRKRNIFGALTDLYTMYINCMLWYRLIKQLTVCFSFAGLQAQFQAEIDEAPYLAKLNSVLGFSMRFPHGPAQVRLHLNYLPYVTLWLRVKSFFHLIVFGTETGT